MELVGGTEREEGTTDGDVMEPESVKCFIDS